MSRLVGATLRGGKLVPRRGTAASWADIDPVLELGEIGVEEDGGRLKIGDGETAWNDLPYDDASGLSTLIAEETAAREGAVETLDTRLDLVEVSNAGKAGLVDDNEFTGDENAFANRLLVGYNPSVEANPTNPGRWSCLDFAVVTDRGTGNRAHTRSETLVNVEDPSELVYRRSAAPSSPDGYGPNGDGTGLTGVLAGAGLGGDGAQGLIPQGSFQGWSGREGWFAAEDCRQDALSLPLAAEITLPQATITVTGDLGAVAALDGQLLPWHLAGTATIGGQTVTYSHRTATTLYGCEGGAGTFSAGATITQTRTRSGGFRRLQLPPVGSSVLAPRTQTNPDGSHLIGQAAINRGSEAFLNLCGGKLRHRKITEITGLTASVVGTPGTTTATWWVIGRGPSGETTLAAKVTITNAPNTLNDTNYVKLTWNTPTAGIIAWDVIRGATNGLPAATGPIILSQSATGLRRAVDYGQAVAGINAVQTVLLTTADGGTFTLAYTGAAGLAIAYNASAAAFQAALEAAAGVGAGQVSVEKTGATEWRITFTGTLAALDVAQLIPDASGLTNSLIADSESARYGILPTITVRTRTRGGAATYADPARNTTADAQFDGTVTVTEKVLLGTDGLALASDGAGKLTVGGVAVGTDVIVRKTADETVNNVGAVQDDDELLFAAVAHGVYFVTAEILALGASANADWLFGWSGPSGAGGLWGVVAPHNAFTGAGFGQLATSGTGLVSLRTLGQTAAFAGFAGTQGITVKGTFTLGNNAGNIVFRWAQNTATNEDSKILTNSFLRVVRIG